MKLLDTKAIADMLGLTRGHVTGRLTKMPGFPPPVVNSSQKMRKWDAEEVMRFLRQPRRAAISSSVVR